ncbi:hypothetical protein [Dysgonomonas sp. 511]|uniref:hypothetical protein n=1 Tax=Dysgonomonas sp. 511 TaxID=2302930 RepID=UPI0013D85136|nr:hypothetical protein [Dysgonomonas sp. 511]NDV78274.1 hypothetical protein [Dysgonomonas sp. 511]
MKNLRFLFFSFFFFIFIATLYAQEKKLLVAIDSKNTKELVSFKYEKNRLASFSVKGILTFSEYSFKYDKATGQIAEYTMNEDRGELTTNSKFDYTNKGYILETEQSKGKKLKEKLTEENKIYIDSQNRLTKTIFDDGKLWEEFRYDTNNNIVRYIQHSAIGKSDIITTNEFYNDKSILSGINLPAWFWAVHMSHMKWCGDFIGGNNLKKSTVENLLPDTLIINVTYDYDDDGYPLKQYYNGELAKEFTYIKIK